jgi:hypothetical protein
MKFSFSRLLYRSLIKQINTFVMGKKTDSFDILHFANIHAAFDSAKYYNQRMTKSINFDSDLELLTHALKIRSFDGQILEFGVASGRTINHISSIVSEKVYGFDVFSGLPEVWRTGFDKGFFSRNDLPKVNSNVELIIGLFDTTLDDFVNNHHRPISMLHIDCDLYAGTKTIFDKLGHLIKTGTVIVFDEYFNYPGWELHEFKAFQEFVELNKIKYRYDSFVSKHQQVCVVIE